MHGYPQFPIALAERIFFPVLMAYSLYDTRLQGIMGDVFNKLDWKLVLRTPVKFVDLQWSAGFVKFYPFIKACHIFFLRENARNDFQCL